MKVRFLRNCCGTHGSFVAGQVVDIAQAVGIAWGRAGVCEPVVDIVIPPKPVERTEDDSIETAAIDPGETAVRGRGRPRKVH